MALQDLNPEQKKARDLYITLKEQERTAASDIQSLLPKLSYEETANGDYAPVRVWSDKEKQQIDTAIKSWLSTAQKIDDLSKNKAIAGMLKDHQIQIEHSTVSYATATMVDNYFVAPHLKPKDPILHGDYQQMQHFFGPKKAHSNQKF